MTTLILASSSPYRQQLLQQLQIPFSCQSPDIDETALHNETAPELVERLSIAKAKAITPKSKALIIGSDQVASLQGQILTKPGNFSRAKEQLQFCSGQTVTFFTGLCLYNTDTQQHQYQSVPCHVTFRELSDSEITHYLQREEPYDCAGSFKAEGLGVTLFKKLETTDPNSLIGLPLIALTHMLIKEGANPLLTP